MVKSVSTATNSSKFLLLLHLNNAIQSEYFGFNDYNLIQIIYQVHLYKCNYCINKLPFDKTNLTFLLNLKEIFTASSMKYSLSVTISTQTSLVSILFLIVVPQFITKKIKQITNNK